VPFNQKHAPTSHLFMIYSQISRSHFIWWFVILPLWNYNFHQISHTWARW